MRAVVVCFDRSSDDYSRLLDALIRSWKKNATIPLQSHKIPSPAKLTRHWGFDANTRKLEVWAENFTQDTIFIDADMLCLDCPSTGFDLVDDIGITNREGPIPINGGVMFLKYTKRGKEFMNDFVEVNARMMKDVEFHRYWQKEKGYAGMNQSAIGYLIENEYKDFNLLDKKYNLTEPWSDWKESILIHLKGRLRRICLHDSRTGEPHLQDIKEIWGEYAEPSEKVV